jgi:hypothetical protein
VAQAVLAAVVVVQVLVEMLALAAQELFTFTIRMELL